MINFEALFKISYGLYIVSSGDKVKGNGFIANTVFQVTSDPPRFAISCNKNNFTTGLIQQTNAFSVSVLHKEASPDLFGLFGFRSGKDLNKMEGMKIRHGETGVPIVLNDSIAFLEIHVVNTVDAGTHLIFIGELLNAEIFDDEKPPLDYLHYRQNRRGVAPKNAPTYIDKSKLVPKPPAATLKKHKCTVCGFIFDEAVEGKKFADLPTDWTCPICGCGREDFMEISL